MWLNGFGSVTVDAICANANIQKGSFYHFFRSKLDVAAVALETHWESIQPDLDRIFGDQTIPPTERIVQFFNDVYCRQLDRSQRFGQVMGCPFVTLGTEVIKHESVVSVKAKELMARYCLYFETALKEARANGDLQIEDVRAKALEIYGYLVGGLIQARIANDAEILRQLSGGVRQILGIPKSAARNSNVKMAVNQ